MKERYKQAVIGVMRKEKRQALVNQLKVNLKQVKDIAADMEKEKFKGVRSLHLLSLEERLEDIEYLLNELFKDKETGGNAKMNINTRQAALIGLINEEEPENIELLAGVIWKIVFAGRETAKGITKNEFIAAARVINQSNINIESISVS